MAMKKKEKERKIERKRRGERDVPQWRILNCMHERGEREEGAWREMEMKVTW